MNSEELRLELEKVRAEMHKAEDTVTDCVEKEAVILDLLRREYVDLYKGEKQKEVSFIEADIEDMPEATEPATEMVPNTDFSISDLLDTVEEAEEPIIEEVVEHVKEVIEDLETDVEPVVDLTGLLAEEDVQVVEEPVNTIDVLVEDKSEVKPTPTPELKEDDGVDLDGLTEIVNENIEPSEAIIEVTEDKDLETEEADDYLDEEMYFLD